MKAMWNGAITFGLINIPVRAYVAAEESSFSFHMLHKKDLSPIRFARICKEDNEEVPYQDIVKGYEYEKDKYVVIDEKELKAANVQRTSTMEIQYFAPLAEIDPVYFEKPYYLEPDKKGGKAYQLLLEALDSSDKVAIVSFVFHNREHIGAILAHEGYLLLMQMRFASEVRSPKGLDIPKEKISPKEVQMAVDLVDQLSSHFAPAKHHDTYAQEIDKLIARKLKGKKLTIPKEKKVIPYQAEDLMGLLQASMKKGAKKETAKKTKTKKVYTIYPEAKKSKKAKVKWG